MSISLPFDETLNDGGTALRVNESLAGIAIWGTSFGDDGYGAYGTGVYGQSDVGTGVQGDSKTNVGVQGQSVSGIAIWGASDTGRGVVGHSKTTDGVQGISEQGTGVFGEGPRHGLHGKSRYNSAVYGEATESGDGVTGRSANGSGVAGVSSRGTGVYGRCDSDVGEAGHFDGNVYVKGNVTVTGDICLANADCAEDFEVIDIADATPGSVMVLHPSGAVGASEYAYDTRVAGVISGAGVLRPGIVLDRSEAAPTRRPLALMGKVYCKVDATYGPIAVGDLLTSSSTPGHAMKASNRTEAFGAVIGKALKAHETGTGLIPILVGLR